MKRYDSYKDSGVQWIGEIPSHWEIARLKIACKNITDGSHFSPKTQAEGKPYVTVSNVNNGLIDTENSPRISDEDFEALVKNGCQPKIGDVLLTKDGSVGRTAIVKNNNFVALSSLGILTPSKILTSGYLRYSLESNILQDQMTNATDGSAIKRITITKICEFLTYIPTLVEQTAIANYLDNKCSKIDNVIATQEKRVELLRELKLSIITRAVTRGINPDAKMKDSGVEWIGEIPEHWEIMPIKRLARIQTGTTPSTKVPEYFEPEEIKWFTPGDVTDELVMTSASRFVSNKAKNDGACRIFPPKSIYFVGIGATIGKVGVCDEEASSNQQINALMVNKKANYKYLAYILRCQKDEIYLSANVVTLPIINQEKTEELLSPVPPIEEQESIVAYIEQQTSKLDSSITKALRQIELLKEYKQSLITEVVTGKRKVC